jgi:hypothetical protein
VHVAATTRCSRVQTLCSGERNPSSRCPHNGRRFSRALEYADQARV